ncbi:ABC transporter permease [Halosolutus gelatinilyticus]|uniref:ABC transporter permease n=1 Tax=Halosolutus gelatinilyticus TaxID=2931975 RepID=UPI001FF67A88|nr:ABC transporter permease [Halosolutus gelatinilyticus]
MDLFENLRMAWRTIRGHRLRSTLTTLGVVIGIGSVITFVTLGASLQGAIIGDLAGVAGSPTITVTNQPQGADGGPEGVGDDGPVEGGGQAVFTEYDIQQLQETKGVETVVPEGSVSLSGVTYSGQSIAKSAMTATTPAYFSHTEAGNFSAGGPFSPGEREVVLNEAAATIFEQNVTVGDSITVTRSGGKTINATVVGILEGDSGSSSGFDSDDGSQPEIYGPTDPFHQTRLDSPATGKNQHVYSQLTVVAVNYDQVDQVATRVTDYFTADSDAQGLLPSSYEVSVQTDKEVVNEMQSLVSTFTSFVTGIAVISLIVGAIGIANIMLVSVTERTREIGIMKAVGFQNRDILELFLVEAVILGLFGSVFGIILGALAGYGTTTLLALPFTFPIEWAGIAVAVGVLVGVVAGLYPAWNGARIDPIEALRYE